MAATVSLCIGLLLLLLLQLHTTSAATDSVSWGYDASNGPGRWPELVPRWCSGRRQSPIHLRAAQATLDSSLITHNIMEPNISSTNFLLQNNGNSFSLSFRDSVRVMMGGSSRSCYSPVSMHWHWGSDSTRGSEHWLEGRQYPMEGHIVMWDCHLYSKFDDVFAAIDGLAVLGVVYEESSRPDNSAGLAAIHNAMNASAHLLQCTSDCPAGAYNGSGVEIPAFSLKTLLPADMSSFFMYDGSLTTPDCRENVLWTVYRQPLKVSSAFLDTFRRLRKYNNSTMSNNYRILQELNPRLPMGGSRILTRSFGVAQSHTTTSRPLPSSASGVRAAFGFVVAMATAVLVGGGGMSQMKMAQCFFL